MVRNIAAYRFVDIDGPAALADALRARCEAHAVRGTAIVAPEGVNLFLAGAPDDVHAVLDWLHADPRFAGMPVKASDSDAVPFARLKVKVKREIITFDPTLRPHAGRAPAVQPATFARWLAQGHCDAGRPLVVLDTRNREEIAHGTFEDAVTLGIDNFTELPAAASAHAQAWRDATVVSVCTGGIRCEKSVLWMRDAGFANALQLDGGILGYFEAVGGQGYAGACFVFDERVALDPSPPAPAPR